VSFRSIFASFVHVVTEAGMRIGVNLVLFLAGASICGCSYLRTLYVLCVCLRVQGATEKFSLFQ